MRSPKSSGLDPSEKETLAQLELLAKKLDLQAYNIRCAIDYSIRNETTKGLAEMVAYSFNAQQYNPNYGGGGANLPVGRYKGVIVDSEAIDTKDAAGNVKGGYIAFTLTPIEGPLKDQKHVDRLNVLNMNPKTVQIANEQLSAYCHVIGVFNFVDTSQLHNRPFCFEIGYQKGQEPSEANPNGGYTEVKMLADLNGNIAGKASAGPQVNAQPNPTPQPQGQPAAGVQPQGQWPQAGGGGAPAVDSGVPMQQPQGQPQPAPNGWGGGQPQGQPAAQQGAQWGQQPQAGGGSPGWGAR